MAKTITRGQMVCRFIEKKCHVPEGAKVGELIKLAPFQKRFILAIYDNRTATRHAYLSIARKNGKSALIASLMLAHLVGPEAQQNSQIISGARSREQAGLIFTLAQKMILQSPQLQQVIKIQPSKKTLIGLARNVEYRALAAEGSTAHGLSPVLAILDEVGQVRGPQDDFVDAITTSQGAHERPLLIAISTQAPTDADLFSIWLDDAKTSRKRSIVSHVYEAPESADLDDKKAWRKANPALGLFRGTKDVSEMASGAMRMPSAENTFRNLVLNQRVDATTPFVSSSVWKQNGGLVEDLDPDIPCWAGLDLSARTDLTSLVVLQHIDGVWNAHVWFWTPSDGLSDRAKRDRAMYDVWAREGYISPTPGATVDYEFVATEIAEKVGHLNVQALGYDRWRIHEFQRELDRVGVDLPLVEHGQGFKDMAPALDALEAELLNGRIAHGLHPVLTMCAANAVITRDPAGNRKLDKKKATGRIDGMVALAMAMGRVAKDEAAPVSPWEDESFSIAGNA